MSTEYLNIKIKLSKSQFRLISKKVPPADLSLKLHYIHKNYFEGPKIYTCTVKTLFEIMVCIRVRLLEKMMCFQASFFLTTCVLPIIISITVYLEKFFQYSHERTALKYRKKIILYLVKYVIFTIQSVTFKIIEYILISSGLLR